MTGLCKICEAPINRHGRALTCSACADEIYTILTRRGFNKKWILNRMHDIIDTVKVKGMDVLVTYGEGSTPATKKKSTPEPIDVMGKYIAMVREYTTAVASAKSEKARIDEEAMKAKDKVDENLGRLKARLDEYTRLNASTVEPFIQSLAKPVIEQKEIEKTRQQHADEAAAAAARRAEIAKEMRESA